MNAQIRTAESTEAELLSLLAFESKAHWGYSSDFMEACVDELRVTVEKIESDEFTYTIYESDLEIVGFYAIQRLTEKDAELEALFVKPKEIGSGIGKRLMKHAIQFAKGKGFTSLKIHSDPNAEKFYLASGAVLVGKQESESVSGRYLPVLIHSLGNT